MANNSLTTEMENFLKKEGVYTVYKDKFNAFEKAGFSPENAHIRALESTMQSIEFGKSNEDKEEDVTKKIKSKIDSEDGKSLDVGGTNSRKIIEWIYDNINKTDLSIDEAPSEGAYLHLLELQKDPELKREFFRTIWPKILPKATVMEELNKRMEDDGRTQFSLIERMLKACKAASD